MLIGAVIGAIFSNICHIIRYMKRYLPKFQNNDLEGEWHSYFGWFEEERTMYVPRKPKIKKSLFFDKYSVDMEREVENNEEDDIFNFSGTGYIENSLLFFELKLKTKQKTKPSRPDTTYHIYERRTYNHRTIYVGF
jgi:hypothetical protein